MALFGQGGTIGGKGSERTPEPMLYRDADRTRLICDRIAALDPDIVALQEVWDPGIQQEIRRRLTPAYPYGYIPSNVDPPKRGDLRAAIRKEIPPTFRWLDLEKLILPALERLLVGSGLMLFSKSPQTDCGFLRFAELHGDDEWATKGVAACTIQTDKGAIRMGVSHAGTDCGGEMLPHISDIIYQTCQTPVDVSGLVDRLRLDDANERYIGFYVARAALAARRQAPAIMVGDFNVNWAKERAAYEWMNTVFRDVVGGRDAYQTVKDRPDSWRHYQDELAGLLAEHRAELAGVCDPGPALPEDSGSPVYIDVPIVGKVDLKLARVGPSHWYCPPVTGNLADSPTITVFRKGMAHLVAEYGLTANDPANLLGAYFGRRCAIRYLAEPLETVSLPTRLDYVYFANAKGTQPHLTPTDVEVLTDWVDESLWNVQGQHRLPLPNMGPLGHPTAVHLSDHHPMLATFDVA